MRNAILYIHGKNGSADEADRYRKLCPGCQVYGLACRGTTPWETKDEITAAYEMLLENHSGVTLTANSVGAYFAMNALQGKCLAQALFISPIVDMEKLIHNMMGWADVTEAELETKREIPTPFGEVLSWEYLQYVRAHPITWTVPTRILYGEKDNLTDRGTIRAFAGSCHADLTVMPGGEHWFHTAEQMAFHDAWAKRYL